MLIENLSLIIPTLNDHKMINKNFNDVVNFLKQNVTNFEILIISNGSSRESLASIDLLSEKYSFCEHIVINDKGKGLAIKQGIHQSTYHNLLISDADFSVNIFEFTKFVKSGKLISGLVSGNRRNKNSENLSTPVLRKLTGYFYIKIVQIIFDLKIEDTQCGFKAIDKSVFKNSSNFYSQHFSYDLELFLLAKINNIVPIEIPVRYIHNHDSKVQVFKDTYKMLKDIIKIYQIYKS